MDCKSVSDLARELGNGLRPRDISDLFYSRLLDDAACPIVCGRRLIPVEYVPAVVAALRERGRLPVEQEAVAT